MYPSKSLYVCEVLEEKVSVNTTTTTAELGWYGKPELLRLAEVGPAQVLIFLHRFFILHRFLIHNCTQIMKMLCSVAQKKNEKEGSAQEIEKCLFF